MFIATSRGHPLTFLVTCIQKKNSSDHRQCWYFLSLLHITFCCCAFLPSIAVPLPPLLPSVSWWLTRLCSPDHSCLHINPFCKDSVSIWFHFLYSLVMKINLSFPYQRVFPFILSSHLKNSIPHLECSFHVCLHLSIITWLWYCHNQEASSRDLGKYASKIFT